MRESGSQLQFFCYMLRHQTSSSTEPCLLSLQFATKKIENLYHRKEGEKGFDGKRGEERWWRRREGRENQHRRAHTRTIMLQNIGVIEICNPDQKHTDRKTLFPREGRDLTGKASSLEVVVEEKGSGEGEMVMNLALLILSAGPYILINHYVIPTSSRRNPDVIKTSSRRHQYVISDVNSDVTSDIISDVISTSAASL